MNVRGRQRLKLFALLTPPLGWLTLAYFGALAVMLVAAFWRRDSFTFKVVKEFTTDNFRDLVTDDVNRAIIVRTVLMAAAVTVTCIAVAMPTALWLAKSASTARRRTVLIALTLPLWASYLVKIYAWRTLLSEEGPVNWLLSPLGMKGPGFGLVAVWLCLTYLWLPYMLLPLLAGFERLPNSLLEASADLGAPFRTTMRAVVLPQLVPSIVAGSIFTFSLSLGDYFTPQLVSKTQFIGTVIRDNVAVNPPFAAAYAFVPVLIMVGYLALAKRTGAFESL